MLSFRLVREDLPRTWSADAGGLRAGSSWIEPLRHPALEDVWLHGPYGPLLVVRERCVGHPSSGAPGDHTRRVGASAFARAVRDARTWPLQWISIRVETPPERTVRVTIESGPWGTAPVWAVARGGVLRGHWDPAGVLPSLPAGALDPERAGFFLARFDNPYSRATLFPGLTLLTERSRARWHGEGRVRVVYPPAVQPPPLRRVRRGADVTGAFWEILQASVRRWVPPGGEGVGAELSGGLDSALAAAAARAAAGVPLRVYGLSMPERAEDQRARRAALVRRFGLCDHVLELTASPALAPGSVRAAGGPVLPWEESYYEAVDGLRALAAGRGTRVLLTGLGGDELSSMDWDDLDDDERAALVRRAEAPEPPHPFLTPRALAACRDARASLDRAPAAAVESSAVESVAYGSALYLRRGIWPVHPLCTPELVTFCRSLPRAWRERRRVERRTLARQGCPRRVTHPACKDDFSPALRMALRGPARPLLERLFRSPRLADLGLVDPRRLRASYASWCADGDGDGAVPFYAAAVLELALGGPAAAA